MSTPNSRRAGFTLVELLTVTVVGSLLVMSALQILITNQRTYTAQSATVSDQQSTRMSLDLLFNELREVSPAGGDLLGMGSDSIRVRLMRRFSIVCDTNLGTPSVTVMNYQGKKFSAADSVFVFADNAEGTTTDDVWIEAKVTAIDSTTTCPHDSSSATKLSFAGQGAAFAADSVGLGAPVRSHDVFTFAVTTFRGQEYLGRRQDSGAMIPIAGPLEAGGLEFVYRDAYGAITTTASDVRQIEVVIRSGDGIVNSVGAAVSDSISAWIYTRN